MPNPKRRHSHARGAKRRTHYKVELAAVSTCPSCRSPRPPHVACPTCGFYKDRRVEALTAKNEE